MTDKALGIMFTGVGTAMFCWSAYNGQWFGAGMMALCVLAGIRIYKGNY